jgi:hypothetical protein
MQTSQHAVERFLSTARVHPNTRARMEKIVKLLEQEIRIQPRDLQHYWLSAHSEKRCARRIHRTGLLISLYCLVTRIANVRHNSECFH